MKLWIPLIAIKGRLNKRYWFSIFLCVIAFNVIAQTPQVTIRFSNPQFNCETGEYCLSVDYQSDTPAETVFRTNVRFFYDDDVLEFIDFRNFVPGYGPAAPNPPAIFTGADTSGLSLFNLEGPAEFVNGAVQLMNPGAGPPEIATDGWTKIFEMCFDVVDPNADLDNFCPSVIWDLEQDPINGGYRPGDDGVVVTLVNPDPSEDSKESNEWVIHNNWEYSGNGITRPFGMPNEESCLVIRCIDLALEKDVENDDRQPLMGTEIDYTVTVTNIGSDSATNVTVSDTLPSGLKYISSSETQGAYDTLSGIWDVGDLAPTNGSATLTITAEVLFSGDYVNLARVETANGIDPNSQPGNKVDTDNDMQVDDDAGDEDDGDGIVLMPLGPDIDLQKTASLMDDGDGIVEAGEKILYTFKVTNIGNVALTDVTISDPKSTVIGGPIPNLPVGAADSTTFSGEYILLQSDIDAGTYVNQAIVTGTGPRGPVTDTSDDPFDDTNVDPDEDGNPDDSTRMMLPHMPSIVLEKTGTFEDEGNDGYADPGETISYKFKVTNTGNVTLTNVVISDPKIAVNGSAIPSLIPGQMDSTTFWGSFVITQADIDTGEYENIAHVTTKDPKGNDVEDDSDDPTTLDPDDPTITEIPQNPLIGIAKSALPESIDNGDNTFTNKITLKVRNNGNVTLHDIMVYDDLKADFGSYVLGIPNSPGQYTVSGLTITSNSNDVLVENPGYNGDSDIELLDLSQGGSLEINEEIMIEFDLRFFPDFSRIPYMNQATASGDILDLDNDIADGSATDDSDSGTNATNDLQAGGDNPDDVSDSGIGSTDDPTELIVPTGSLGGTVWKDLDGDGVQDLNEPGLGSAIVRLFECTENGYEFVTLTITQPSGDYFFANLPPASYRIEFNISGLGSDLEFTLQNVGNDEFDSDPNTQGKTGCVDIGPGQIDESVDAGVLELSSIGDFVWNDMDGDGIQDNNESGIADVVVKLFKSNSDLVETTETDNLGHYLFENIYPGDYFLKFYSPDGYSLTDPEKTTNDEKDSDVDGTFGPGTTDLFSLSAAESDDSWDAGYYQCAQIGELVWYDTNMNDRWDNIENGINGLRVNLMKWDNETNSYSLEDWMYSGHKPGTPSDDGYFKFCVKPGRYYLEFELPPYGLVPARANVGSNDNIDSDVNNANGQNTTSYFNVSSGEEKCDLAAGYYPMATIGDLVWRDINSNGVRDSDEPMSKGTLVEAFDVNNDKIGEATTDKDGHYKIEYLRKEDYYLKFSPPDGYNITFANAGVDESKDSDVDHSYGPNTTQLYTMWPGVHMPNVDAGFVFGVLPVELINFVGTYRGDYIYLEWATANEINSDHFIVERRFETEDNFIPVGRVKATGNSNIKTDYKLEDYDIDRDGIYYYRLKSIDRDGSYEYSDVISVELDRITQTQIEVYPNPAVNSINLDISLGEARNVIVHIFDVDGKIVKRNILNGYQEKGKFKEIVDINQLTPGVYTIKCHIGKKVINKRIVVMRN